MMLGYDHLIIPMDRPVQFVQQEEKRLLEHLEQMNGEKTGVLNGTAKYKIHENICLENTRNTFIVFFNESH